jgi:hypothetical protein
MNWTFWLEVSFEHQGFRRQTLVSMFASAVVLVQFNKSNPVSVHSTKVVSDDWKFVRPSVVICPNADVISLLECENRSITAKQARFKIVRA